MRYVGFLWFVHIAIEFGSYQNRRIRCSGRWILAASYASFRGSILITPIAPAILNPSLIVRFQSQCRLPGTNLVARKDGFEPSLQNKRVLPREVENGWGLDGMHLVFRLSDGNQASCAFHGSRLQRLGYSISTEGKPLAHHDL